MSVLKMNEKGTEWITLGEPPERIRQMDGSFGWEEVTERGNKKSAGQSQASTGKVSKKA